jgi:hypothetical protein
MTTSGLCRVVFVSPFFIQYRTRIAVECIVGANRGKRGQTPRPPRGVREGQGAVGCSTRGVLVWLLAVTSCSRSWCRWSSMVREHFPVALGWNPCCTSTHAASASGISQGCARGQFSRCGLPRRWVRVSAGALWCIHPCIAIQTLNS